MVQKKKCVRRCGEKTTAKKSVKTLSYKDAGVDIDAGNEIAANYLKLMQATFTKGVVRNDGGFGGMFSLKEFAKYKEPVLISGTDGVGTKLQIAIKINKHDTIGIDLVAMSVNDILVQGAKPLFFMDYVVTDRVNQKVLLSVVKGISDGCVQSDCALLGGETAEHPDCFPVGEYDLAGFAVGVADKANLITGKKVKAGDVIIGLDSTGVHSNGFTLARKALLEVGGLTLGRKIKELGCTLGEALLEPTKIYVKPVFKVLDSYAKKGASPVHGIVHITGGGIVENTPRILPAKCDAVLERASWKVPPIFDLIQKSGNVGDSEMDRVFNMGIGMMLICDKNEAANIVKILKSAKQPCQIIGEVKRGSGKVIYK